MLVFHHLLSRQGHRKVIFFNLLMQLFKASSESLELQVFTTFFIEFALKLGSNAIFLEQNLDVLDQWFEVEQMDSRITSWWTMRINKHVIFQIHESQDPSVNTIKEVVSAFVVKINSHSILSKMLDVIGALLNRHEHL